MITSIVSIPTWALSSLFVTMSSIYAEPVVDKTKEMESDEADSGLVLPIYAVVDKKKKKKNPDVAPYVKKFPDDNTNSDLIHFCIFCTCNS